MGESRMTCGCMGFVKFDIRTESTCLGFDERDPMGWRCCQFTEGCSAS